MQTSAERQDLLGPVIENAFGERYFPSITGESFTTVGSDAFYQRQFGKNLHTPDTMFLILGTDGGLLLDWVIRKQVDPDSRYLFIELEGSLDRLREEFMIPETLPDNVHLCPLQEWMKKAEELSMRDYFYVSKILIHRSISVVDGYHDGYVALDNAFEEEMNHYRFAIQQEIGTRIFSQRGIENLAENRLPIALLDDCFKGKTAVLMAGGPSLDESFDWVHTHRRNLVILAVTRIAPQLKRVGIVPDFLFAIDPHGIIFHQSKEMLDFHEQAILVNMYHLNSRLLGQWQGEKLFMGPCFPWTTDKNPPITRLYPGITVSHQALGVAIHMGFSQIILKGFDLCFSKEGFTHAKGSEETLAGPYAKRTQLWVETNGGWMAETSADFHTSIPSLSQLAAQADRPEEERCRVINPSPTSAKIEHVEHLPWETLQPEPLEMSPRDRVHQVLEQANIPSEEEHFSRVDEELKRVRDHLIKIKKLTEEAVACNDKLFGRRGKPPNFKYKKRMDEIEESLDNDFDDISRFVRKWSIGDLLRLSSPNKEKEWSDEQIEETGRRYYEIYRDSTMDFLKFIDAARKRLRARMEEIKPKPKLKNLLDQWEKDTQPGRVLLYLRQHNQALEDFPEKQLKALQALLDAYQADREATETDYKAHCQNNLGSPMAILGKASGFFNKKDLDRLNNFLEGMRTSNLAERDHFVLLMEGYLAELSKRWEEALVAYRKIDSDLMKLECLKRILSVHLSQSDIEGAVPVAKTLSDIAPLHSPIYGDLLRLSGNRTEAVKVYTTYLDRVQGDAVTEMKLGRLYGDMGDMAAAREVFLAILEKDPDNKAARQYLARHVGHDGEE